MGSIGNNTFNVSNTSDTVESTTRENEYGFEVENTNSSVLDFTDSTWERMAELRSEGKFRDSELRSEVDDRISELVDQYGDLSLYDEDLTNIRERMEESEVTDDEYWTAYHVMASYLNLES